MYLSELEFFSHIDFGKLDLPSDTITLKHLRATFPTKAENIVDREGERLDAMWDAERLFVLLGYASVLGKEAVEKVVACIPQDAGQEEAVKELAADLIHFGIADGPATAGLMIERLQELGVSLARQRIGRTPR
jgi:hypothetical protein